MFFLKVIIDDNKKKEIFNKFIQDNMVNRLILLILKFSIKEQMLV